MRLGHCKSCWWYKDGRCYMHRSHVLEIGYCPDYYNRTIGNKEDGKLSDWIKEQKELGYGL